MAEVAWLWVPPPDDGCTVLDRLPSSHRDIAQREEWGHGEKTAVH